MNKKVQVKKQSTFLSSVIVRRALVIITVTVVLLVFGLFLKGMMSGVDIEAADVFAVLVLLVIGLGVLVGAFIGIEKLTGKSCLKGLELIGEYTLESIAYLYNKLLSMTGVEIKKTNRRVKKRVNISNTKLDIIHEDRQQTTVPQQESEQVQDELLSTEKSEPELGFTVSDLKNSDKESNADSALFQDTFKTEYLLEQPAESELIADDLENEVVEAVDHEFDMMASAEADDFDSVLTELLQQEEQNLDNEDELIEPFETAVEIKQAHQENEVHITEFNEILPTDEEPVSQNLLSDLSRLYKQDGEKSSNNTQSWPQISPVSIFEQAKQSTANIIAGLQAEVAPETSNKPYQLPSISLLETHQQTVHSYTEEQLDEMSRTVESVLLDYKVTVEVQGAYPGPVITRFELALAPGIKVSRISGLAKDLARAMRVTSVRVVEIIAGTSFVGLEIPNQERELVSFREIIASDEFQQSKSPLTLSLGKDVAGKTVVSDLSKMPHVLVAGTTGSGKSVAINTMILSMLYKATPEQVRMIMIDPKMLELSIYEGIPHLLTPVVTDMKEAQSALRWAVAEMERRYKLMSKVGVRNLAGFNQKIEEAAEQGETIRDPLFQLTKPLENGESFPTLTTLPQIVIVIDELADMMMIVGKKVEELIARLAQKARAAGIHLVLATQRPSVDVLTGLIKANVPTRMSFQVSSRIDSRTILDQGGAEALLGNGDMLFLPSGTSIPIRAHGAFVGDDEVHHVVEYLKTQRPVKYLTDIIQEEVDETANAASAPVDATDALYNDALDFIYDTDKASISSLQRRFKIGYNRAARMIDQMEEENIVSQPEGNGSRSVIRRD